MNFDSCESTQYEIELALKNTNGLINRPFVKLPNGAPGAIRTRGTRFRRAVLCPLSYGGAFDIVALIVRLAPSLQDALQDA